MFNLYDDSVANFHAWRARQRYRDPDDRQGMAVMSLLFVWIGLVVGSAAAWATHVIACIKASAWILLAFGCLVAPVGVVHGIGIWLGVF